MSGSTRLGVKSTLLAVTAGPHTVQSVLGFTHSLELLLLLNSPKGWGRYRGGEGLGRGPGTSFPSPFLIRKKTKGKILSFFGFQSRRTSSLHLLFEEQEEEGREGLRDKRTWALPRAGSTISVVPDESRPRAASAGERMAGFCLEGWRRCHKVTSHLPRLTHWPVFPDKILPSGSQRSGA